MTETQARPGHGDFATDTRLVEWARPGQGDFDKLLAATGLEQLRMLMEGELPRPPIMDTLGMTGFHAEPGRVVVEMPAETFHYNPLGGVHGGVISTLLDTAAACSVHSTLAVGEMYTSLDLTVKFLRPVTADSGLLTCEGTVLQRGRRTALAQAELTDGRGKVVAHAISSCMIFPAGG
jgi:uncharacterized protein (TIGR00369 family)